MLQMISNLYDNNNKDTPRTHFGLNQVKPSYAGNSRHAQLANLFVRIAPLTIAIYSQLILIVEFIISFECTNPGKHAVNVS